MKQKIKEALTYISFFIFVLELVRCGLACTIESCKIVACDNEVLAESNSLHLVIITYGAKLPNADWLRERGFFLNFGNCPRQNYLILIGRTGKKVRDSHKTDNWNTEMTPEKDFESRKPLKTT